MKVAPTSKKKDEPKEEEATSPTPAPVWCTHGPGGKCLNCLDVAKVDKEETKGAASKPNKTFCSHGPGGKCINCIGDLKETEGIKQQCSHGPKEKCVNCLDEGLIKGKHTSFEHHVSELKKKCEGLHQSDQKCQNCMLSMDLDYKVKLNCKSGHKPYPQGMCNKCIPPSIVLKW